MEAKEAKEVKETREQIMEEDLRLVERARQGDTVQRMIHNGTDVAQTMRSWSRYA